MKSLSSSNQSWHRKLDTQYQKFLESLTALDLEPALEQWQRFRNSLSIHIEFEETRIEPLTLTWEDNTQTLIRADHLILKRLLPRLQQSFEEIVSARKRRAELVRQLDSFIKLRNVLEHHDQRENEHLYPALDMQLDDTLRQELASAMIKAEMECNES